MFKPIQNHYINCIFSTWWRVYLHSLHCVCDTYYIIIYLQFKTVAMTHVGMPCFTYINWSKLLFHLSKGEYWHISQLHLLWHNTFANQIPCFHPYVHCLSTQSLIARFMEPKWGPPGANRTQVCPMWATWPLLSGMFLLATSPFSQSLLGQYMCSLPLMSKWYDGAEI